MANTNVQRLQAVKSIYLDLLVLVNLAAASPTQANVEAAITAVNAGTLQSNLVCKPDYSLDGESYQWAQYAETIARQIDAINKLIQAETLPWIARGRNRP